MRDMRQLVLGLAFGLFDKERAKIGHVAGMWVDPGARGRGAGRALLDAAIAWARSRALDRLEREGVLISQPR